MLERLALARELLARLTLILSAPSRLLDLYARLSAWASRGGALAYNAPPGGYGPPGGGGYGPPGGGGYGPPGGGGYGPPGGGGYGPPGGGGYGPPGGGGYGPPGGGPPGGYPGGGANYGSPPGAYGTPPLPQNNAGPAPSNGVRMAGGALTIATCLLVMAFGGIAALLGLLAAFVDKVACSGADLKGCGDLQTMRDRLLFGAVITITLSIVGVVMGALCLAAKPWAAIAAGIVMALLGGVGVWTMFVGDQFHFHWYVVVEFAVAATCIAAYPQCKAYQAWRANGGR